MSPRMFSATINVRAVYDRVERGVRVGTHHVARKVGRNDQHGCRACIVTNCLHLFVTLRARDEFERFGIIERAHQVLTELA